MAAVGRPPASVGIWLGFCALLVFSMVVLGGAVRLTGSGLSMVDWQPLIGAIPPLDQAAWQKLFEDYQQFPEFQLVNRDMTLSGFKFIFLMEYAHRVLGRLIGLVFLLPFIYFAFTGAVSPVQRRRLLVLFMLGGIQGLIGWYMVRSGLVDDPNVSQYRLALHFMVAVLIYMYMLRVLVGMYREPGPVADSSLKTVGIVALLVVLAMMTTGAFVAGTRAGHIFNTWPLMGENWLPAQLMALDPLWRNLFENPATIQFIHRWFAVVVVIVVLGYGLKLLKQGEDATARLLGGLMLFALAGQFVLGVVTLLYRVPVPVGVAHQAGAMVLLTFITLALARYLPILRPAAARRL